MTDRELLELAAKACGYDISHRWNAKRLKLDPPVDALCIPDVSTGWNPLEDDGQAQRLAVKLGIAITPYPIYSQPKHSVIAKQYRNSDMMREANPTEAIELHGNDPAAATRRAIVRCAAAMVPNAELTGASVAKRPR